MMPAVLAERAEEALEDVVQRHVVVAGHDDLRRAAGVSRKARASSNCVGLRALRQVARDDDTSGSGVGRPRASSGSSSVGVDAAEVQVGEVDEGSHRRCSSGRPASSAARMHAQARRADAVVRAAASSPSPRRRWRRAGAVARSATHDARSARSRRSRAPGASGPSSARERELQQAPAAGALGDVEAAAGRRPGPRRSPIAKPSMPYSLLPMKTNGVRAQHAPCRRRPGATPRKRIAPQRRQRRPARTPATCRGRAASAGARGRARCRGRGRGSSC